jgi:hypothetical protein
MAFQLGQALVNTRAGAIVTVAAGGEIRLYSQAKPASCASAEPGTAIATGTLPSPALANTNGSIVKAGTWTITGTSDASTGTDAASFRLYASDGTTCIMQGEVTNTSGAGPLKMNNVNIADGQVATVNTYAIDDTDNL